MRVKRNHVPIFLIWRGKTKRENRCVARVSREKILLQQGVARKAVPTNYKTLWEMTVQGRLWMHLD